jgi:hypothetical protein
MTVPFPALLRLLAALLIVLGLAVTTPAGAAAGDDDDDIPVAPVVPTVAPPVGPAPIVDHDGDPTTDGYRAGQAILRLVPGADVGAVAARHGLTVLRAIPSRSISLVQLPAGADAPALATALTDDPDTAWAELNFTSQAPEGRPRDFFVSATRLPGAPADAAAPVQLGLAEARACATGAGARSRACRTSTRRSRSTPRAASCGARCARAVAGPSPWSRSAAAAGVASRPGGLTRRATSRSAGGSRGARTTASGPAAT